MLKEAKYNGCYFDRTDGGDHRLCTREGWFTCQVRPEALHDRLGILHLKRELGFAPVSPPPSGLVRSGHVLVSPLHQSLQQPREPHHLQHLESGPQVAPRSFRPIKRSFKPGTAAKTAFNH